MTTSAGASPPTSADKAGYRICTRCIMDTSDPDIRFDEAGVCSHCHGYDEAMAALPVGEAAERVVAAKVAAMKAEGAGRDYDCIIGVSGGVDSTYVALKVKELGLRPLAIHFDSGWNSELAVANIEKIVKTLDIDLYTFVVDWQEMRDLQLAFFRAGVPNADIPTDHGFMAVLYHEAARRGIRHIVSGHNFATEGVLPRAWGYGSRDLRHLRAIQRRFGTRKLRRYPQLTLWYDVVWCRLVKRIEKFEILNYLPYDKDTAKQEITGRLGWRDYGGKHYESVFTRFFQGWYLPKRFGYDKRRAHLSSLVLSGQFTRDEALEAMGHDHYPEALATEDREFVAKKLGVSDAAFAELMQGPTRAHAEFPSNDRVIRALFSVRDLLRGVRGQVAARR